MTTRKTTKSGKWSSTKPGPGPQEKSKVTAAKRVTRSAGKRGVKKSDPRGLKVRMYRVGFGDFFLVTVPTSSGDKYILIDCGVFKGTSGTGDLGSIVEAVKDMHDTTNGRLALVIMTHRHADHIAGFAKADFTKFEASMVWMPYWEKFNDGKNPAAKDDKDSMSLDEVNASYNLLSDIGSLAENLGMLFRGRDDEDAKEALAQLGNATGVENFSAAGTRKKKGGLNAKALEVLKNQLGGDGTKVRYYAAGDEPEVPSELVGLKATILGPPPQQASAFMALTDLKKGVGQYLDAISDGECSSKKFEPFAYEWNAQLKKDYKGTISRQELMRCKQKVDKSQPDMLVAAAAKIETFLNNQSLVVLFEFGGKKLLFAGDAQAGNWEYWLYRTKEPLKDPTKAGEIINKSKELLQTIDFYKVGHHGSTNATPIQAIETAVIRPKSNKGFVSMCSTEDGVYGNPEKGTEVPRSRLMEVLRDGSSLIRSDSIKLTVTTPIKKVVEPAKGVKVPQPKVGKVTETPLYIEYSF